MNLKEVKLIKEVYDNIISDNTKALTSVKISKAYSLIFQDEANEQQSIETIIRWVETEYQQAFANAKRIEEDIKRIKSMHA